MAVAMGIGRFALTPILPWMMEALDLDARRAGLIASANFVGYLAGALIGTTSLVVRRRSTWYLAGLAASVAPTAGMGLSGDLVFLMAVRFVAGVASAFILVAVLGIVFDALAAADRLDLAAVHFAGVGAGITISALAVPVLVAAGMDWRGLWAGSGLLAAAAALPAAWLVARAPGDAPVEVARPARIAPDRPVVLLSLAYGLFGYGYSVTATFLVTIARRQAQSDWLEPIVWVMVGLAAIPSVGLWRRATRRIGALRGMALACLVEAAGVAASVTTPPIVGLTLGGLLLGGTFVAITALGLASARALRPRAATQVMALVTAAFGTGQILGPIAAGILADMSGSFLLPSLSAAAMLLIAAALAWRLDPQR